jgi:hypothetical protein
LIEDRRLQNQARRPRLLRKPEREVRSPVASTRSPERRLIALRQANHVRRLRAKLKQDLRGGKVRLQQILTTPADYLASAEVFDLLVAVPKIGPAKGAGSSPSPVSARPRPSVTSPSGSGPGGVR